MYSDPFSGEFDRFVSKNKASHEPLDVFFNVTLPDNVAMIAQVCAYTSTVSAEKSRLLRKWVFARTPA